MRPSRLDKIEARLLELLDQSSGLEPYQQATWREAVDWLAGNGRPPVYGVIENVLADYLPPADQCRWLHQKTLIVLRAIVETAIERGELEELKSPVVIPEVVEVIKECLAGWDWDFLDQPVVEQDVLCSNGDRCIRINYPAEGRKENFTIYPDGRAVQKGQWNSSLRNWERVAVSIDFIDGEMAKCFRESEGTE